MSGTMSLHFHTDTYVIIWLIHVLLTHLGIFLLPLDIGPEMCIFIYPHDPQAFENVEMKFSKCHRSSTILMLLMLRLDGVVVGFLVDFAYLLLQNDGQVAFMEKKKCFEAIYTI